jgi:hypothetical protein
MRLVLDLFSDRTDRRGRCYRGAWRLHQAGMPEQVRADLTLLEVEQEDAVHPACQQPGQLVLRIHGGSLRRSSPSLTRISKA